MNAVGREPLALDTIIFARGLATPPGVRPALAPLDLDVLPGEIFSIVGRAGAGKTLLLEALIGFRAVRATHFQVCGTDPRALRHALTQRIGIAPRGADLDRKITVEEALRLFAGFYARADPQRALEQLRLQAVRRHPVESLSPDGRQRVSIALALVNDPVVLFADEPTRDLDPDGARLVWELLRQRRERGRTSVITTNHLDEAARLSDRVAILDRGALVAMDTPAALVARSSAPAIVTLELLKPDVPIDELRALPGALEARMDRAAYAVTSSDGPATLRALLRLLDNLHLRPLSVGLRQQTLEDVFFELTATEPRPPEPEVA